MVTKMFRMIKTSFLLLLLLIKTSRPQQQNFKHLGEGSLLQSLHKINYQSEVVSARNFLKNFISKQIPVVYANSVRLESKNTWNDETLVKFANVTVSFDLCKVENRSCGSMKRSLAHFIKHYKARRYYLVDNLPGVLSETFFVPPMLLCEEIIEKLQVKQICL